MWINNNVYTKDMINKNIPKSCIKILQQNATKIVKNITINYGIFNKKNLW